MLKYKDILFSTTNKVQLHTMFFIIVDDLHVSGGFFAHLQELKNCTHSIWYVPGLLLHRQRGWAGTPAQPRCVYSS
jgi:hypothetical protein